MPRRAGGPDMGAKIDGSHHRTDPHNKLLNAALKNMHDVKNTPLLKLHGAKSTVTYFEQFISDRNGNLSSTASFSKFDPNLQTYNRIEHFIILTEETSGHVSQEMGEGMKEEGSATILPNTIIPNPNDYFMMKVNDRYTVYRVTKVEPMMIEQNSGYKIDYKLYKLNVNHLTFNLTGQIAGDYDFVYNHVGTQYRTIMRRGEYQFLENSRDMLFDITNIVKNSFYNRTLNSIFCDIEDINALIETQLENITPDNTIRNIMGSTYKKTNSISMFDPHLVKFMVDNDLFSANEYIFALTNYYKTSKRYRETIFYALETRLVDKFKRRNHAISFISRTSYMNTERLYNRYMIDHTGACPGLENVIDLFPMGFTGNIDNYDSGKFEQDSILYESFNDIVVDVISVFLNEDDESKRFKYIENLVSIGYDKFKGRMDDDEYESSYEFFYTYPIMIYILKFITREISTVNYK